MMGGLIEGLPPFIVLIISCVVMFLTYKYLMLNINQNKHIISLLFNFFIQLFQLISLYKCKKTDRFQFLSNLILSSPSSTIVLSHPLGKKFLFTADPGAVQHILKTHFPKYSKGTFFKTVFGDLFGDSLFTVDGEMWKLQRRIASAEFGIHSLHKYIDKVIDFEISQRLLPVLSEASKKSRILDLQDILNRFSFDNVCMVASGHDSQYLLPSFPKSKFAIALEDAVRINSRRIMTPSILWKLQRFHNIGGEKRFPKAVHEIREYATAIVREKKASMSMSSETNDQNILSRFLKHDDVFDEKTLVDIVISFIIAGRDTTAAGLTWFFWLLHKNKRVEEEIVREIFTKKSSSKINIESGSVSILEELKNMVYTQAALYETMRLYPPVPMNTKQAVTEDVLPDGTKVSKGMIVNYLPYVMGRSEEIWGSDWAEFRPERWLEVEESQETKEKKLRFVPRDPYSYPVFQAGPRICLGKDLVILQMKRVVIAILERFSIVPAMEGFEPIYLPTMAAKMKGGFPVKFEKRSPV